MPLPTRSKMVLSLLACMTLLITAAACTFDLHVVTPTRPEPSPVISVVRLTHTSACLVIAEEQLAQLARQGDTNPDEIANLIVTGQAPSGCSTLKSQRSVVLGTDQVHALLPKLANDSELETARLLRRMRDSWGDPDSATEFHTAGERLFSLLDAVKDAPTDVKGNIDTFRASWIALSKAQSTKLPIPSKPNSGGNGIKDPRALDASYRVSHWAEQRSTMKSAVRDFLLGRLGSTLRNALDLVVEVAAPAQTSSVFVSAQSSPVVLVGERCYLTIGTLPELTLNRQNARSSNACNDTHTLCRYVFTAGEPKAETADHGSNEPRAAATATPAASPLPDWATDPQLYYALNHLSLSPAGLMQVLQDHYPGQQQQQAPAELNGRSLEAPARQRNGGLADVKVRLMINGNPAETTVPAEYVVFIDESSERLP